MSAFGSFFERCMNQPVYVSRYCGTTEHGDSNYSAPFLMYARVEPKRSIVYSPTGEEVVSDFKIYCLDRIGLSDRIWLPGKDQDDVRQSRTVKDIFEGIDEDGSTSHYEVSV